jgi:serine/threonine protein kinase
MAHKDTTPDLYKKDHRHSGHVFARKLMLATSPDVKHAINSEAETLRHLFQEQQHDNLIHVFTHGWLEAAKLHYSIDMELADLSLYDYINYLFRNGSLPPTITFSDRFDPRLSRRECTQLQRLHTTWVIAAQICNGLQFMHLNGHIHRDLKPQNGTFPDSSTL